MDEEIKKELLADNYPSNSKKTKIEVPTEKPACEKKLGKVVTGTVKKQKRGLGKKMAEVFLEDDTKSVGSYILYDILIPAAKDLISDMVGGGIEMLLFGERRNRRTNRTTRQGGKSFTSYGSYFSSPARDTRDARDKRDISRTGRSRFDFEEVVLDNRGEAEEVLSLLVDQTIDYGQATVSDLYDLLGITSNFTDEKYGWTDLRAATVSRARGGGYVLNLPRPRPLD